MWIWIVFGLSVALIPWSLWLHRWIPPFTRATPSAGRTSGAWLFGLVAIALRFLLQVPAAAMIGLRPLTAALSSGLWLGLTLLAFAAVEVALACLHTAWMQRATGPDRFQRSSVRVLGPAYFLALVLESVALGRLLWAGRSTAISW